MTLRRCSLSTRDRQLSRSSHKRPTATTRSSSAASRSTPPTAASSSIPPHRACPRASPGAILGGQGRIPRGRSRAGAQRRLRVTPAASTIANEFKAPSKLTILAVTGAAVLTRRSLYAPPRWSTPLGQPPRGIRSPTPETNLPASIRGQARHIRSALAGRIRDQRMRCGGAR